MREINEPVPLSGWFRTISFLWASLILILLAVGLKNRTVSHWLDSVCVLVTASSATVYPVTRNILLWKMILTYLTPKIRAASLLFIFGSNPPR